MDTVVRTMIFRTLLEEWTYLLMSRSRRRTITVNSYRALTTTTTTINPPHLGGKTYIHGTGPSACCYITAIITPALKFHTSTYGQAQFSDRNKLKTTHGRKIRQKQGMTVSELINKKQRKKVIEIQHEMTVEQFASILNSDIDQMLDILLSIPGVSTDLDEDTVLDENIVKEVLKKANMSYKYAAKNEQKYVQDKDIYPQAPPDPASCKKRPPVVTVMGHVDHGKTTLLDSLRNTRVAAGEAGGITQHIGAFLVKLPGQTELITFLDTPGHAAFSAIRARGADVTDIVVLIVAADDGVMNQTQESIRFAREAGVPVIVAINKCDLPAVQPDFVKQELVNHGVLLEGSGGNVQCVEISALTGDNLTGLAEAILAQAELLDLKTDPGGLAEGVVIESHLDKGRGAVATALVQRGTLKRGDCLIAGTAWAKIRAMYNEHGEPVSTAPPSCPVKVIGWRGLPKAGDIILQSSSEARVKDAVSYRGDLKKKQKQSEESEVIAMVTAAHRQAYMCERLSTNITWKQRKMKVYRGFSERSKEEGSGSGEQPQLAVVIKGDVNGSIETIQNLINTYDSDQCDLDVVHCAVGDISENDIQLAETFSGTVIGFNVGVDPKAKVLADRHKIPVKLHTVIYKLLDDLKQELSQRLPSITEFETIGEADVLQIFTITEGKNKVSVAGCRVRRGQLYASNVFRVVRAGRPVHQGTVTSLKHFKEQVSVVSKGMECGIQFSLPPGRTGGELQVGDLIECCEEKTVEQTIDWDPGF